MTKPARRLSQNCMKQISVDVRSQLTKHAQWSRAAVVAADVVDRAAVVAAQAAAATVVVVAAVAGKRFPHSQNLQSSFGAPFEFQMGLFLFYPFELRVPHLRVKFVLRHRLIYPYA